MASNTERRGRLQVGQARTRHASTDNRPAPRTASDESEENAKLDVHTTATDRDERQLLNKHAVEKMTLLDTRRSTGG